MALRRTAVALPAFLGLALAAGACAPSNSASATKDAPSTATDGGSTTKWGPYSAQLRFADVFGRLTTNEAAALQSDADNPTLQDVANADANVPANAIAKEALTAVLNSVAPGESTCKGLLSFKLPWVRIDSAEEVPKTNTAFAHCKVLGVIEKEIRFEVDLPGPADWNGKFLMGGGGGFQGTLDNSSKPAALNRGYAAATTDTGHVLPKDGGASWALHSPERLVNFGHRGTHVAAATAKLVIHAYYKKPIQHSFYYGGSGSGKMALMEATRYPEDFDGVIAGCPGLSQTRGSGLLYAWTQQQMYPTAEDHYKFRPVIAPAKVKLLDAAVQAKCDAVDGLKDDIITNPSACAFDPMKDLPRCIADHDGPDCFTTRQLDVIKKIHDGPSNSAGPIFPGYPYGGESIPGMWLAPPGGTAYIIGAADGRGAPSAETRFHSRAYLLGNDTLRFMIFQDPDYDLHSFNYETDVPETFAAAEVLDPDYPDLNLVNFKKRGGKLIMWAGLSDWSSSNPYISRQYFERTVSEMGGRDHVVDFYRLFMIPSVGHCPAIDPTKKVPGNADFLTALDEWVVQGKAPDRVIASHYAESNDRAMTAPRPFEMPTTDTPDRTRPLCPYPEVGTYTGSGSIDDAANFVCRADLTSR